MSAKVKDFVESFDMEIRKPKIKNHREPVVPIFEVLLVNDLDFVIRRKTKTTDRTLGILLTQENFYLKNNKTDEIKVPIETEIANFFSYGYFNITKELAEVDWVLVDFTYMDYTRFSKAIVSLIRDKLKRELYKNKIFGNKYTYYGKYIEINKKLGLQIFKQSKLSLDTGFAECFNILKLYSYDKAIYFLEKSVDANVCYTYTKDNYRQNCLSDLCKRYNLDINRLIDYVFEDLYHQGISTCNGTILDIYSDYLNMQLMYYGKIKDRYPKALKTQHDIMSLHYSFFKKFNKEQILDHVNFSYNQYAYDNKDYCIILPKTTQDIVSEGIALNHCVASYVDKVLSGKSYICFLRSIDNPQESLATIEIVGGVIMQARISFNKMLSDDSFRFLVKWAMEKDLKVMPNIIGDRSSELKIELEKQFKKIILKEEKKGE